MLTEPLRLIIKQLLLKIYAILHEDIVMSSNYSRTIEEFKLFSLVLKDDILDLSRFFIGT